MNGFDVGEKISVHTYEFGVVKGEIIKSLSNMIIVKTKEQGEVKVLI